MAQALAIACHCGTYGAFMLEANTTAKEGVKIKICIVERRYVT